ncbi:MAG: hypothetical protein L6Q73_15525 [Aquabacterium sp.]|nr:hypothetical protein [Aquabacterium sp.]
MSSASEGCAGAGAAGATGAGGGAEAQPATKAHVAIAQVDDQTWRWTRAPYVAGRFGMLTTPLN